jgi:hypothetical protein
MGIADLVRAVAVKVQNGPPLKIREGGAPAFRQYIQTGRRQALVKKTAGIPFQPALSFLVDMA